MDLAKFIFIDQHAHSLRRGHLLLDALAFRQCFSESRSLGQLQLHANSAVSFLSMIAELSKLLDVNGEESLLEYRASQNQASYINYLWDDVSIAALIIDDGFRGEEMMSLSRLGILCERPVYGCRRIENVLEQALDESASFRELQSLFVKHLTAPGSGKVVAWKTICGYRGGLQVEAITARQASADFDNWKSKGPNVRIARSPLYHYFLAEALQLAAEKHLPVQIHCGIGDDDADLRECNPLCMRGLLRSNNFSNTTFVFLHCYPYVAEAAYLCSLYPNVFMDLSLSTTLVAPLAEHMILQALSGAPSTKLLAGSDGHSTPETHWYGALNWRRSLERALSRLQETGYINEDNAYDVAARVLHENARQLYSLEDLV